MTVLAKRRTKHKPPRPAVFVRPKIAGKVRPSSEPSDELKRHANVRAIRGAGYERVTRVESLFADGRIDSPQKLACERYYMDWALGVEGVRVDAKGPPGSSNASAPGGPTERAFIALASYRETQHALGRFASQLLDLVVCHDESMTAVSRATKCTLDEAPVLTVICIKALAEHYHEADNAKRRDAK